jgi:hypothetical protein
MPARRTLHVSVEEREALEDLRDHAPSPICANGRRHSCSSRLAYRLPSWPANACCVRAIRKPSLSG